MAKLQTAWPIRLSQYQGRMTISCHPDARSARNEWRAGLVRGASLSRARLAALTVNEAASIANTIPGPETATSRPAAAEAQQRVALLQLACGDALGQEPG